MSKPSYPAKRSSGPKNPPQLDSAHRPVAGDLAQTVNRPTEGPAVPLSGPLRMRRGFSGPGPKTPPQLDSAHRPVAGDLAQTVNRPTEGPAVPLSGPLRMRRGFSGPSG